MLMTPSSAPASSHAVTNSLDLLRDTYNYNHWIYSLLRPHLGTVVLEIGSGIGNITQFLLSCDRLICVEPEKEYLKHLQDLMRVHGNVRVVNCGIESIPSVEVPEGTCDTVLCLNVLEHIQDDLDAVRRMTSVLKKGGRVVLYVPACSWAYGAMDKAMIHHRRYSRATLRSLAVQAELRMTVCRYVNFAGLLGWWWAGRVRKETLIDPLKARMMDRLVPFTSALERLVRPPLGQSLFAVMTRDR